MAQLVLWLRVCHKAMVVAKLDSGKIFFQVHSVAIVRPPFLSGCWLKASLISLPLGLSIGQLTTWQLASVIYFICIPSTWPVYLLHSFLHRILTPATPVVYC